MNDVRKLVQDLKPVLLMALVQVAYASVNVLYKLAINDGMSIRVVTAYRLMFAVVFTFSLSLIFERKSRPKLTWRVLFLSFFSGLFGASLFHNLFLEALDLVSATFATAVYNLVPAVTFILAISCGIEKLNMQTAVGKAKVLGTIIGIGGSMVLTFFKGVEINVTTFRTDLLHHNEQHVVTLHSDSGHKFMGVLCGFGSCFSFALWLIIQSKMSKEYPCHYSSTALMSLMAAIQATAFALYVEKDWSQWKLGSSIRIVTVVYTGIVASGLVVIIIAWCVRMRGPMFVSVFNPVMLVLVAVADSFMLGENLYVGSVIGAVLIVSGLYMVLWGKSKEMKKVDQSSVSSEITQEHEATEVVVMPTTINNGNSNCIKNANSNCESNAKVS
ncbi:WAT1-related protein At1g68170 isoform X1 [Cajanus cajan]|uniref:WAT1-related protein n=1 Tax=Cajanus cajan TaxID=3821 RepID=A0A151RHS8_CAJCA|nr:WAT1-related protein At1g68170 isoform X1 [Cajanus cajan]KYP42107.1 Auxin-induced protein 5NG4 [Cajanus cajan]